MHYPVHCGNSVCFSAYTQCSICLFSHCSKSPFLNSVRIGSSRTGHRKLTNFKHHNMGIIIPKKPNTRGCVKKNGGVYVRQNRQTGTMFTVKLCNPVSEWTDAQKTHRSNFGLLCSAVSRWVKENKEANTEIYQWLVRQHRRQDRYKTIRCMILGRTYAKITESGEVEISIPCAQ